MNLFIFYKYNNKKHNFEYHKFSDNCHFLSTNILFTNHFNFLSIKSPIRKYVKKFETKFIEIIRWKFLLTCASYSCLPMWGREWKCKQGIFGPAFSAPVLKNDGEREKQKYRCKKNHMFFCHLHSPVKLSLKLLSISHTYTHTHTSRDTRAHIHTLEFFDVSR